MTIHKGISAMTMCHPHHQCQLVRRVPYTICICICILSAPLYPRNAKTIKRILDALGIAALITCCFIFSLEYQFGAVVTLHVLQRWAYWLGWYTWLVISISSSWRLNSNCQVLSPFHCTASCMFLVFILMCYFQVLPEAHSSKGK